MSNTDSSSSRGGAGKLLHLRGANARREAGKALRANVDTMDYPHLLDYARHCGAALARAHAKVGDAAAISGYIGKSEALDAALARFAAAYADRTEKDFDMLRAAAKSGRIPVEDI
jgi:hypothetical protein